MAQIEKTLDQLRNNTANVSFAVLAKVCGHYVYKMPWAGDPRINIQDKNGKAKTYQVKQVLNAIGKFKEIENG